MGTQSRRKPGSVIGKSRTDSGYMPREVRLSAFVWRHPSQKYANNAKNVAMVVAMRPNSAWLSCSHAMSKAPVTTSRSRPNPV